MSTLDLVVTGGTVVDGTGAPGRRADVGVLGGRVAVVSDDPLEGDRVVDARGLVVAPGFVDLHSHADFTLEGSPGAVTQLTQGVTTLVTGNCGASPFPVGDLAALRRATAFMDPRLGWDWTDLRGWTAALERARPALNVVPQVGHSALRLAAVGDEVRPCTEPEVGRMTALLGAALAEGAGGFSTGLIYAPGSASEPGEVHALARVAARHGVLCSTHLRDEGPHLLDALEEAMTTAEVAGARLQVSHLKVMGPAHHGAVRAALTRIDAARAAGIDVAADVYPYAASSTTLTSRLPGWALDGGTAALLQRLASPEERLRVAAGLRERFGRDVDPAGVVVAALPPGPLAHHVGRSLTEIGDAEGLDPAEAALSLLAEHEAAVAIVNHAMSEDDVDEVLRHPAVAVASDGWVMDADGPGRPHPRSFGTFPRVLGHHVRERGLLSLPEAVRKMTSLPASRIGLADRGVVAPGAVADLAVLDPATVADRSTYAEPWRLSTGIRAVLVAGRTALVDGTVTDERAGAVLRPATSG